MGIAFVDDGGADSFVASWDTITSDNTDDCGPEFWNPLFDPSNDALDALEVMCEVEESFYHNGPYQKNKKTKKEDGRN